MKKRKIRSDKGKTLIERVGVEKANEIGNKISRGKLGCKRPDMTGPNCPQKKPEFRNKISKSRLGKKMTEETKQKLRDINLGNKHKPETIAKMKAYHATQDYNGKNNNAWKGGTNYYGNAHYKAWKLFFKDSCEICGITNEQHKQTFNQRLHMHNTLLPKDYDSFEASSWSCICKVCHGKLEKELQNNV